MPTFASARRSFFGQYSCLDLFGDICGTSSLKSGTSFSATGAGHQASVNSHGRRGSFWSLLKRWQAWVEIRHGFETLLGTLPRYMMLTPPGSRKTFQVHFQWQALYLYTSVRIHCNDGKPWFFGFSLLIFAARTVFGEILTRARANLLSACACWIALVVARCWC